MESKDQINHDPRPMYRIKIPASFFEIDRDFEGEFDVVADEVALVLVGTWNSNDPGEGEEPLPLLQSMQSFLQTCRAHGLTIIHAPNYPVVSRYPQYPVIRETVEDFIKSYPAVSAYPPPFLDWPPGDNDVHEAAKRLRNDARAPVQFELDRKWRERDVSRFLKPLDNEIVLASHDEFRYVLWKRGIKLLLYMGSSLAECLQHRDTAINILAGVDSRRTAFTIVLLEDCCSAGPTSNFDGPAMTRAMLDYFKRKIAFVASSKDIAFHAVGSEDLDL